MCGLPISSNLYPNYCKQHRFGGLSRVQLEKVPKNQSIFLVLSIGCRDWYMVDHILDRFKCIFCTNFKLGHSLSAIWTNFRFHYMKKCYFYWAELPYRSFLMPTHIIWYLCMRFLNHCKDVRCQDWLKLTF